MSEHDPEQSDQAAREPLEDDEELEREREAQSEDPTSPTRGFHDLEEAEGGE